MDRIIIFAAHLNKNTYSMKLKQLFALVIIAISFASCRVTNLPESRSNLPPYVQLKSGQRYEGTSVNRSGGLFVKDKIELGDTAFKAKDVALYSSGVTNYANVSRKTFATQVMTGKINLYKYENYTTTTNSHGGTSTQHNLYYYIQKADYAPVLPLTYKNLSPLIKKGTPEFNMMEKYHKSKTVAAVLGGVTAAMMITGTVLLLNKSTGPGTTLLVGGTVPMFSCVSAISAAKRKLLNAVLIADKPEIGQQHHKRVR